MDEEGEAFLASASMPRTLRFLARREKRASHMSIRITLCVAFGLAFLPLPGCGDAPGVAGTWAADPDATVDLMVNDLSFDLPPEARAEARQRAASIKQGLPADMKIHIEQTKLRIHADGTWSGTGVTGSINGTWKREKAEYVLTTAGGQTLYATFDDDEMTVSGPELPFSFALKRE